MMLEQVIAEFKSRCEKYKELGFDINQSNAYQSHQQMYDWLVELKKLREEKENETI